MGLSRAALKLLEDLEHLGSDPRSYMDMIASELEVPNKYDLNYPTLPPQNALADRLLYDDIGPDYVNANQTLKRAMENYTGSGYSRINRPLRRGVEVKPVRVPGAELDDFVSPPKAHVSRKVKQYYPEELKMTRALARSFYPSPVDLTLYRGISPDSKTVTSTHGVEPTYVPDLGYDLMLPKLHDDYGNTGFMSTSFSPGIGYSFGSGNRAGVYKILVPEGAPIRPLLGQSGHGEFEVLLPPYSRYIRTGDREGNKPLPLMWVGRGKPDSGALIGGLLPLSLLDEYDDERK